MRHLAAVVLAALFALPLAGQSSVLFQSDGSSISDFPCGYGALGGVATVNLGDGLPAPSIEFFTSQATNLRAAPYVIPGLVEGEIFHGSQDVKFESNKGYVTLGFFGMPTDASCPAFSLPGPVPFVGYRIENKRADWIFVTSTGATVNIVQPDGSLDLAVGEWHRTDLFMYPQGDGTNQWEVYVDGTLIVSETSYEPIVGATSAGVVIGMAAQSDQTLARYDNIEVEIIETSVCEEKTQIQTLTMRYTGDDCSASSNSQVPKKAPCTDFGALPPTAHIVVRDKPGGSKLYVDGWVSLNDTFTIDPANAGDDKLKSNVFAEIYDTSGNVLQAVGFHTSCSEPLSLGDQFGSLSLVGFVPRP